MFKNPGIVIDRKSFKDSGLILNKENLEITGILGLLLHKKNFQ